jgi:predicted RNA-binding Zn-ribbon protein involved in translation (DUF1610 family)
MTTRQKPKPFICPICGSPQFGRVVVPRDNGTNYVTTFYHCAGCSVMFTDREAFTLHGRKHAARPPDDAE